MANACAMWVVMPNGLLSLPVGKALPSTTQSKLAAPAALQRVLARGQSLPYQNSEFDPLEMWMAQQLGWNQAGSAPVAWAMVGADARQTPAGSQWWVSPVHIEVGVNGVGLLPPEALRLSREDANMLWALVDDLLVQNGWQDPGCFAQKDLEETKEKKQPAVVFSNDLARLKCTQQPLPVSMVSPWSLARAKLTDFLPTDNAMRPWRQLWMQIQMALHDHPVNLRRQANGLPVVNAFWWWGGGAPWQPSQSLLNLKLHRLYPQYESSALKLDTLHRLALYLAPWLGHCCFQDSFVQMQSSVASASQVWHVIEDFDSSQWLRVSDALTEFDQAVLAPLQHVGIAHGVAIMGQVGWRSVLASRAVRWRFWKRRLPVHNILEHMPGFLDEEDLQAVSRDVDALSR